MKELLAASLLLGLLAGATAPAAQAQTPPAKTQVKKDERRTKADDSEQPDASRGSRGPGSRLTEMTNGLNLTSEQQTNVAAIWQKQVQQLHALRGTGGTEDRAVSAVSGPKATATAAYGAAARGANRPFFAAVGNPDAP